jgi:hypothetical protein
MPIACEKKTGRVLEQKKRCGRGFVIILPCLTQAEQGGAGDDRHGEGGQDGLSRGDRRADHQLRGQGEAEDSQAEGETGHPHSRLVTLIVSLVLICY